MVTPPAGNVRGTLPSPVRRHFHTITELERLAELLRTIDAYGSFVVRTALRLLPLIFARPGNLAAMEWSEVDLKAEEWRIPAGKRRCVTGIVSRWRSWQWTYFGTSIP